MSDNYYAQKLNSEKLFRVYDTRIERVRQYLDSEIDFVRRQMRGGGKVLELGAGYGRIMKELAPLAGSLVGLDISEETVALGREYLKDVPNCRLEVLDAHALAYEAEFDVVIGLQNALSAVKGDAADLVRRAAKAVVPGGKVFFSTYSPKFWEHRLAWFSEQADKGLLGEIDAERSKDGKIVCKDGFVATTCSQEDLQDLGRASGCRFQVREVDESSLFLILFKA